MFSPAGVRPQGHWRDPAQRHAADRRRASVHQDLALWIARQAGERRSFGCWKM